MATCSVFLTVFCCVVIIYLVKVWCVPLLGYQNFAARAAQPDVQLLPSSSNDENAAHSQTERCVNGMISDQTSNMCVDNGVVGNKQDGVRI